jgi:hypothetical protein
MAFFQDPFKDSNLNSETKLSRLSTSIKNMGNKKLETFIFVRGALDHDIALNEKFFSEEFDEALREKFVELNDSEKKLLSTIENIKDALTPEKPTADAYYDVSKALEDKDVRERFENPEYFPERERLLYFHLEFLFNDNPDSLIKNIMPKLKEFRTKNIFNLLKFKILDDGCRISEISEEKEDLKKEAEKRDRQYKIFCDKAILELARFGNMKEKEGVFYEIEIEEIRKPLLQQSLKLILTIFHENISKYLDIEISESEEILSAELEKGRALIEYARRVKKPLKNIEEARELVEKLEKLKFFLTSGTENGVLKGSSTKRFTQDCEELVAIVEEAQSQVLRERLGSSFSIFKKYIAGEEVDFQKDEISKLASEFKTYYHIVEEAQKAKNSKNEKIEKLFSDSETKSNYYYQYINTVLYVFKFFKVDSNSLMKNLLKGNQTQMVNISFCQSFKNDNETTIKDYLQSKLDALTRIYKAEFSEIQKFEKGFELSKEINSIIVKLSSTVAEL